MATQIPESSLELSVDDELYNANEMLNLAAAGGEAVGLGHVAPTAVSANHCTLKQVSFEDANSSDAASSNEDGLYKESILDSLRNLDEEASEGEGVAVGVEDEVHSWRIDHSSGDHKLRRRFRPATPCK
jgi:hypothetical protein